MNKLTQWLRVILTVVVTLLLLQVLVPGTALAISDDADLQHTADGWWKLLELAVTMGLPLAVAYVTEEFTNPNVKAFVLALLSMLTAFGHELLTDHTFVLTDAVNDSIRTFLLACIAYVGVWKNRQITKKAQRAQPLALIKRNQRGEVNLGMSGLIAVLFAIFLILAILWLIDVRIHVG